VTASARPSAPPYLVVKRHSFAARIDRNRPKRQTRRAPDEPAAGRILDRWSVDPDVKAVWLFAPDGSLLHHQTFDHASSDAAAPDL
jgi:hypothetical protein